MKSVNVLKCYKPLLDCVVTALASRERGLAVQSSWGLKLYRVEPTSGEVIWETTTSSELWLRDGDCNHTVLM